MWQDSGTRGRAAGAATVAGRRSYYPWHIAVETLETLFLACFLFGALFTVGSVVLGFAGGIGHGGWHGLGHAAPHAHGGLGHGHAGVGHAGRPADLWP